MNMIDRTKKAFDESKGKLVGGVLFVEHIPDEEVKSAAGLILASGDKQLGAFDADRPHFVRVISVGEGYYDDVTKEDIPLEYEPGNVLLVPLNAIKYFTSFGSYIGRQFKHKKGESFGVGIASAGEEWMRFDTLEDYKKFMSFFGPEANNE